MTRAIAFTLDGESYPHLFGALEDFLIEVERENGELVSGYVRAYDHHIKLRNHTRYTTATTAVRIDYDDIKAVTIQ